MPITPARYLRLFLLATGLILLFIVFFNYLEDPFGIYHQGRSWDWIRSRPAISRFIDLHKAYDVRQAKADILFLGDSRVFNGLDPHSPVLPASAYNLATPGSGIYENLRYLQHAAASHVPTTVVLGIDLRIFGPGILGHEGFSENRLDVTADGQPTAGPHWNDWLSTLLTAKALECSIETLLASASRQVTYDHGYDATWSQLQEHFDQVDRVLAFNQAVQANPPSLSYLDRKGHSGAMVAFNEIVRFCARHQIRLIVFVLPLHASALDVATNDWVNYDSWMRAVLGAMENEAGLKGEFWDFSGYNKMSTEAFTQSPEHTSRTVYYWESSHFKKTVGDLVLSRIFTGQPSSFGRRVTLATLPEDEARLKTEKENWHARGQLAPLSSDLAPATIAPVFR